MTSVDSIRFFVLSLFSLKLLACGSCLQHHAGCPLWHVRKNDACECNVLLEGSVSCDATSVNVVLGHCMTWDNSTQSAVVNHCPMPGLITCPHYGFFTIHIASNTSGQEVNDISCKQYNRQGSQCSQCIDGYGPAAFSDGFTCADCNSQHSHLWFLNLLLQLSMVTLMYVVVVLFQIKGTSSPLNVIITYTQLCSFAIIFSAGVRLRMVCFLGPTMTTVILTVAGILNLDFLRYNILPPMCIASSLKSIHVLLFDYIIAFYPLLLTLFVYFIIKLHDRNCLMVNLLTIPFKKFFSLFRKEWNPKATILNTCITFLLLAYSKLIYTSIKLLFSVTAYNSEGEVVPNSTVLLYDPSIRFFHREHIPYAVLSLFVIVVCVLLPPLLLLCYPTRLFRVCLNRCGFKRWDILHLIADVFQGWFKDGTRGTRDYRAVSSFYLLLRIAVAGIFFLTFTNYHSTLRWYVIGICHIFLGTFFLIAKPYKKKWMNCADGLTIDIVGFIPLFSLLFLKL